MTRPYAEVIGSPIAHSRSPLIHGYWLERLGIDAEYRKTEVLPEGLEAYFASRRADSHWRGCNVTIPHKVATLDYVEDRGDIRSSIGAVNTVLPDKGTLIGTNTDVGGFFTPIAGLDLAGKTAIVVGAGGAARAALYALARCQIGSIALFTRSPLKGAALLAQLGLPGSALAMTAALPSAALLVNASPLGMTGSDPLVLDLTPLPDSCVVYDMVYAPLRTRLLDDAEARGLDTIDGLEMLVGQAALAFELFFDVAPPRDDDDPLWALLEA